MDLTYTPQELAFQQQVWDFFRAEVPDWYSGIFGLEDADYDRAVAFGSEFARKLIARRWLTPMWPAAYGGTTLSRAEHLFLMEAIGYFDDPRGTQYMGAGWVGAFLLTAGTPEQIARYVGPTANAEITWCQGYSEPNAGSDLASLQTRAVLDGDTFVINGQKIWTSYADKADYCVIGVRTDPDAPKHQGISFLIMDMRSPGVTVRPIPSIFGHHFCEVFLDDVRVPRENLVGEINRGWYLMAGALDIERMGSNGMPYMTFRHRMEEMLAFARERRGSAPPLVDDPQIQRLLGERWIEIEALKQLSHRVYWRAQGQESVARIASVLKLFSSEVHQRVAQTGMDVLGAYGPLRKNSPLAPAAGRLSRDFLWCRETTVAGGTSEIQRNIIAQRVLGLPRA